MRNLSRAVLALLCAALLSGADYLGPTRVFQSKVVHGVRFEVRIFDGGHPQETLERIAALALEEAEKTMAALAGLADAEDPAAYFAAAAPPAQQELRSFLKISLAVARASEGAYDPTAGSLAELWGAARLEGQPPPAESVESALRGVAYQAILLDDPARSVSFDRPGIRIASRGPAAAAHAVDRMVRFMRERKVLSGYVSAGPIIRFIGLSPDGKSWRVGLDHPRRVDGYACVLDLGEGRAVASAGDYEDFFVHEGKRLAGVIDARTGRPAEKGVAAVNVIAVDALTAQLAAQAFCALGTEEGHRMLERLGADYPAQAVAVEEDARQKMQLSISDGAQTMITEVKL